LYVTTGTIIVPKEIDLFLCIKLLFSARRKRRYATVIGNLFLLLRMIFIWYFRCSRCRVACTLKAVILQERMNSRRQSGLIVENPAAACVQDAMSRHVKRRRAVKKTDYMEENCSCRACGSPAVRESGAVTCPAVFYHAVEDRSFYLLRSLHNSQ